VTLVDSCGWIEYLADGALADVYAPLLVQAESLLVPTVVIYEVYRWIRREGDEDQALLAVAHMKQGHVRVLSTSVALLAADLAAQHRLAMADAFIYAHAQEERALLVTSDGHFERLPHVVYHPKRAGSSAP